MKHTSVVYSSLASSYGVLPHLCVCGLPLIRSRSQSLCRRRSRTPCPSHACLVPRPPTDGLGTRQPCCCDIVPRRPPMAELQQDGDLFKEEFKRYKRRAPPVDLSSVVDPRYPERFTGEASLGDAFQLGFHPIISPSPSAVGDCLLSGRRRQQRQSIPARAEPSTSVANISAIICSRLHS